MRFRRAFSTRETAVIGDEMTVEHSALGRDYVYVAVNHGETTICGHMTRRDARRLLDTLRNILAS